MAAGFLVCRCEVCSAEELMSPNRVLQASNPASGLGLRPRTQGTTRAVSYLRVLMESPGGRGVGVKETSVATARAGNAGPATAP
jgi:hypothetical protein